MNGETLTIAFNSFFNTELTELQIKGFLWNNKIKTGALNRYAPIGELSLDGSRIKTANGWQTLYEHLKIKELKNALKEKLKSIDEELYKKIFMVNYKSDKRVEKLLKNIVNAKNT